jgi:hypothetical protein
MRTIGFGVLILTENQPSAGFALCALVTAASRKSSGMAERLITIFIDTAAVTNG